MDLIKHLGYLAFASRLKRLSDRLQRDVSRVYKSQSLDFEARWFTVLYILKEQPSITITGAASALGLTHPAINQVAADMTKHGLISSIKDSHDERRRLLRLTKKGRQLISLLEPIWVEIRRANRELAADAGVDLLSALDHVEASLDKESMYDRVIRRINRKLLDKVDIVEYKPHLKRHFKSLNYEWLKRWFRIEKQDEKILSNPYGEIIKKGGYVLFALIDGKVIGTTALIRYNKNIFELTKMAVTEKAQGKQAGKKLALAAIDKAKKHKAGFLFLRTSPKLTKAINLYKKLGFEQVEKIDVDQPQYKRKTILMRLNL